LLQDPVNPIEILILLLVKLIHLKRVFTYR